MVNRFCRFLKYIRVVSWQSILNIRLKLATKEAFVVWWIIELEWIKYFGVENIGEMG